MYACSAYKQELVIKMDLSSRQSQRKTRVIRLAPARGLVQFYMDFWEWNAREG